MVHEAVELTALESRPPAECVCLPLSDVVVAESVDREDEGGPSEADGSSQVAVADLDPFGFGYEAEKAGPFAAELVDT